MRGWPARGRSDPVLGESARYRGDFFLCDRSLHSSPPPPDDVPYRDSRPNDDSSLHRAGGGILSAYAEAALARRRDRCVRALPALLSSLRRSIDPSIGSVDTLSLPLAGSPGSTRTPRVPVHVETRAGSRFSIPVCHRWPIYM